MNPGSRYNVIVYWPSMDAMLESDPQLGPNLQKIRTKLVKDVNRLLTNGEYDPNVPLSVDHRVGAHSYALMSIYEEYFQKSVHADDPRFTDMVQQRTEQAMRQLEVAAREAYYDGPLDSLTPKTNVDTLDWDITPAAARSAISSPN